MESNENSAPKPGPKTTTVTRSKTRTTFGKSKNSVYVIKEYKYELKKFPFPLEKDVFEEEKSDDEGWQRTNNCIPSEDVSIESPFETSAGEEKLSSKTSKETFTVNQSDNEEQKMDCSEKILPNQEDNMPTDNQQEDTQQNDCFNEKDVDLNNLSDIQKLSIELNAVFRHRIRDIEAKAPDDLMLKIRTYQEWVETLLKRNKLTIQSMTELKDELGEYGQIAPIDANTRLRSYRDRDVLVKFIQEAFRSGDWNLEYLKLETVTLEEFLKKDLDKSSTESTSSHSNSSPQKKSRKKRSPYMTPT